MKTIKDKIAKLSFVALLLAVTSAMFYTPTAQKVHEDEFKICITDNSEVVEKTFIGLRLDLKGSDNFEIYLINHQEEVGFCGDYIPFESDSGLHELEVEVPHFDSLKEADFVYFLKSRF